MTANFRRFDFSIRRQRSWFHPCVINKFDKFMERVSGKHPSIPVRTENTATAGAPPLVRSPRSYGIGRRESSPGPAEYSQPDHRQAELPECHRRNLQAGSAFCSSATPAAVTFVKERLSDCKLFSPASSFSPASVTWMPLSSSDCKLLSPASSFSPVSDTLVPLRSSVCKFVSPASSFSPASVTPVRVSTSDRKLLRPASSFSPVSVTLVPARTSDCKVFSPDNPFSPASVTCEA